MSVWHLPAIPAMLPASIGAVSRAVQAFPGISGITNLYASLHKWHMAIG
jgi:hypothetical protein